MNKSFEFFAQRDVVLDANKIPAIESIGTNWDVQRSIFNNGRALFLGTTIQGVDYFRDMEDEFGIIPLPKYDSTQDEYIATAQEWMTTILSICKMSALYHNIKRVCI